jgi:hypothetical protein
MYLASHWAIFLRRIYYLMHWYTNCPIDIYSIPMHIPTWKFGEMTV